MRPTLQNENGKSQSASLKSDLTQTIIKKQIVFSDELSNKVFRSKHPSKPIIVDMDYTTNLKVIIFK